LRTGGKTLQDSRRLAMSITSAATSDSVEAGTNVIYAARHNQGFNGTEQIPAHRRTLTQVFGVRLAQPRTVQVAAFSRKGNTPKREFLGLGPHDMDDIKDLAEAWLDVEP
jgi:phage gpG-like protein